MFFHINPSSQPIFINLFSSNITALLSFLLSCSAAVIKKRFSSQRYLPVNQNNFSFNWHFLMHFSISVMAFLKSVLQWHANKAGSGDSPPYGGLLLEVRMTKPKPSLSLRCSVMSKDSWSRALGIGRRGSLGEPFSSTGVIS